MVESRDEGGKLATEEEVENPATENWLVVRSYIFGLEKLFDYGKIKVPNLDEAC